MHFMLTLGFHDAWTRIIYLYFDHGDRRFRRHGYGILLFLI
jgi:hypothetical protein